MKQRLLTLFLLASFAIHFSFTKAQQHKIDSLYSVVRTGKEDTGKVNTLNALAYELYMKARYSEGDSVDNITLQLAIKLNFKKGLATTYNNQGNIYYGEGNYSASLKNFIQAQKIDSEINYKPGMGITYRNIGKVYSAQGNTADALKALLHSLTIEREIGDKSTIAAAYANIGNVYFDQGNFTEALRNHLLALDIYKTINEKQGIGSAYGNIGNIYYAQDSFPKALQSYNQAMEVLKAIGDKMQLGNSYVNLGNTYAGMNDFSEALRNYDISLKLNEEAHNKYGIAQGFQGIGYLFIEEKKYALAKQYLDSAIILSLSIGDKVQIRDAYGQLAELDSIMGNFKDGLGDYKKYITYQDSLMNEANTKKIVSEQMQYEFDKKEAAAKLEQEKKDAITSADKRKQQIIIFSVSAGLLLVIVFSVLLFSRFRLTQRQKKEIEQQKVVVEEQKTLVEQQKAIVEEKNKDITDSIHYASRIQRALLTTDDYISKRLKEYFILFKPRDIVSGDFYWANEVETNTGRRFLICAGDCTGHGVPGAFMSLLNISLLNEVNLEKKINEPAKILDDVREHIVKALNPEGKDDGSKDGMDCILCSFSLTDNIVDFACANNPLWLVRNKQLIESKPDKMPVGLQGDSHKPFTSQSLPLQPGDCIYIFTDGYADQFGGPKGKKFKYKQLEQLLVDNSQLPMAEQKQALEKAFEDWKDNLEQVDDVLIIGIRV